MRPLLVLACAIVFVDTAFYAAITPLLPRFEDEFGLSKSAAGLLVAAYPAGTLVGAIPGGYLAAKAGVRATVLLGLALMVGSSQPRLVDRPDRRRGRERAAGRRDLRRIPYLLLSGVCCATIAVLARRSSPAAKPA